MKATIKLYKNDGAGEFGYPVKLIISHNRKTRRKTFSYSSESDWDPGKNLPKPSHDDFEDLYAAILEMKKKAVRMEFREMEDFEQAFEFLLQRKPSVKTPSFFEWADTRISFMEKQGRQGNAEAYRTAKNELEKFSPQLDFSGITPLLLESFKNYKRTEGNKNSTIKNYLVEIRAMYNAAVKAGITEDKKPFIGLFDDIPVKKRRAKNRYLPESEILKMEKANLPESYQRTIDFSLLQFYLCGVDLVDLYYLKNENLFKNRVIFTRRKLGERAYEFDVFLPKKAAAIIKKYQAIDGEYVFPWSKEYISYKTWRNNHRRDLKISQTKLEISLEPKNDNLTSKVMRHTFATLGKFKRVEEDLLRELMGHERNDIDTVYKDKYPEAERDAAQLEIIEIKEAE